MFFINFLFYRANLIAFKSGKDEVLYSFVYMMVFFASILLAFWSLIVLLFDLRDVDKLLDWKIMFYIYLISGIITYGIFYLKKREWNLKIYSESKLNGLFKNWMLTGIIVVIIGFDILFDSLL